MIDPRQVSVPSQGKNSVELRRGLALPSPYSSFPSPCGERVLLNKAGLLTALRTMAILVSVPLRGKSSVELNDRFFKYV